MNTSKQVSGRRNRGQSVVLPEQMSFDVLGVITDEELTARNRDLDGLLAGGSCNADETYYVEVELAYVRREVQLRRTRRALHETYLRDMDAYFAASEVGLPVADVDNTKFLRAIGELNL